MTLGYATLGQIGFAGRIDYAAVGSVVDVHGAGAWLSTLSLREREVARLIARGLANKQIAEQLVISERTAEGHVDHIRDKLGLHNPPRSPCGWSSTGWPISSSVSLPRYTGDHFWWGAALRLRAAGVAAANWEDTDGWSASS